MNKANNIRGTNNLINANTKLFDENKLLKIENERLNKITKIMEKYFELIIDLGFDYDGLNDEDSLKKLIDELCRFAKLGRAYNTTETIYVNDGKKYNIIHEELKDSET